MSTMTTVNMTMDAESGVLNLPDGVKETGKRVDFKPDEFKLAIETKGYRVAWSRAALCPCQPINDQTEQPNPNCTICRGSGWLYFAPALATVDELLVGELDSVQLRIVNDNAAVIRAIMAGLTSNWQQYDPIGSRIEGTMNVTARHENRLGYHDRITNLDSLIVYAETVKAPDPNLTLELGTKYPIKTINLLRTESTTFTAPADFTLTAGGLVLWNDAVTAPPLGTRVSVHYLCHPTWLIVQHPHAIRLTSVRAKVKKPATPLGDQRPLPIQAVAKYEWLPALE